MPPRARATRPCATSSSAAQPSATSNDSTSGGQFTLGFAAASITSVAVRPGTFDDWVAVDNLVFAPVPETGLGRAINDRLRRAAAPRG